MTTALSSRVDGPKPGLVLDLGAIFHTDTLAGSGVRGAVMVECTGVSSVVLESMKRGATDAITCLIGCLVGNENAR